MKSKNIWMLLGLMLFCLAAAAQDNNPRTWILLDGTTNYGPFISAGTKSLVIRQHQTNCFIPLEKLSTNDLAFALHQKLIRNIQTEFLVTYDKFKEVYDWESVTAASNDMSQLEVKLEAHGPASDNIDLIFIHFTAEFYDWHWHPSADISFLADGEHVDFGKQDVSGTVLDGEDVKVLEQIIFDVNIDQLRKLAFAKNLELQIGINEITFDYQHRQSWRDFVEYFEPLLKVPETTANATAQTGIKVQPY